MAGYILIILWYFLVTGCIPKIGTASGGKNKINEHRNQIDKKVKTIGQFGNKRKFFPLDSSLFHSDSVSNIESVNIGSAGSKNISSKLLLCKRIVNPEVYESAGLNKPYEEQGRSYADEQWFFGQWPGSFALDNDLIPDRVFSVADTSYEPLRIHDVEFLIVNPTPGLSDDSLQLIRFWEDADTSGQSTQISCYYWENKLIKAVQQTFSSGKGKSRILLQGEYYFADDTLLFYKETGNPADPESYYHSNHLVQTTDFVKDFIQIYLYNKNLIPDPIPKLVNQRVKMIGATRDRLKKIVFAEDYVLPDSLANIQNPITDLEFIRLNETSALSDDSLQCISFWSSGYDEPEDLPYYLPAGFVSYYYWKRELIRVTIELCSVLSEQAPQFLGHEITYNYYFHKDRLVKYEEVPDGLDYFNYQDGHLPPLKDLKTAEKMLLRESAGLQQLIARNLRQH